MLGTNDNAGLFQEIHLIAQLVPTALREPSNSIDLDDSAIEDEEGCECAACGVDVTEDDLVCPKCSRRLGETQTAPEPVCEVFTGEVMNVKTHHFNVQWGRTSSGETVFREEEYGSGSSIERN